VDFVAVLCFARVFLFRSFGGMFTTVIFITLAITIFIPEFVQWKWFVIV